MVDNSTQYPAERGQEKFLRVYPQQPVFRCGTCGFICNFLRPGSECPLCVQKCVYQYESMQLVENHLSKDAKAIHDGPIGDCAVCSDDIALERRCSCDPNKVWCDQECPVQPTGDA